MLLFYSLPMYKEEKCSNVKFVTVGKVAEEKRFTSLYSVTIY